MDRGQAGKEGGMGTGKGKREGIGRIGVCGGYDGVGVHRDGVIGRAGVCGQGGRGVDRWTGGGVGGEYLRPRRQGAKCLSRKF